MRLTRALAEAEAQLAFGTCPASLMQAREVLKPLAPDSPVIARLDDKLRALASPEAQRRPEAERIKVPFTGL